MRTYERNWWCVKEKKKQKMVLLLIIFTMMLQFQIRGCVGCVESERVGLLELKSYLNSLITPIEGSILKSWSSHDPTSDCCVWDRVKCSNGVGGHIVDLSLGREHTFRNASRSLNLSLLHRFPQLQSLNFSFNGFDNLFDPIHGYKSFQRLEKLRTLDLSVNRFNNSVLPFLSAAKSLRTLNLGSNYLEGVFPPKEFANMTELKVLDLRLNSFSLLSDQGLKFLSSLQVLNLRRNQLSLTPKDYSEICRLTDLRELDLSYNALTSMPYCLGNLTRLRTLELSRNQLDGDMSAFVSSLPITLEYLSLVQNKFNGSFSFSSLGNHTRLQVFKLSSYGGIIQPQVGTLWVPMLKMLVLHNFTFGSTIPSFLFHQCDLCFVDLSYNNLTAFPTWLLQNNTRLRTLYLTGNSLTKLQLPRLAHGLEILDISSNRISGSVQEDIGIVFPNLRYMNFASNRFHGGIPSSLREMESLDTLDMSSNDLSGKLSTTFLSGFSSLSILKLSNNRFWGRIFPEYTNLPSLSFLALDGNGFSGSLGKGLLKSPENLFVLDISNNNISGALPLWMSRFSNLGYLNIRGNQLKGPFPRQLQKLQSLIVIDISDNSFHGSIPKRFEFPYLTELRLRRNEFMGTIPDSLFKAEELKVLDLGNNNFSGKIPNFVGKDSNLRVLLLGNNGLQNQIPETICELNKVDILDLSHNQFNGVIPSCLSNMSFGAEGYNGVTSLLGGVFFNNLQNWKYTTTLYFDEFDLILHELPSARVEFLTKRRYETYQGAIVSYLYGLDLSSNQLSGEIPVELGNLQKIIFLNLSSNNFTGSIPDSFSKLKDVESLDLSNNKLRGRIPPQLADLNNIGFFNVSWNNLSGEIPIKGHLLTFDERSYIGNAHLCGPPTTKNCRPTETQERSATNEEEERKESNGVIDMVWFYWTCGAVYISTALATLVFLCIDTHWSREWFYRVDLMVHHLHHFKGRCLRN